MILCVSVLVVPTIIVLLLATYHRPFKRAPLRSQLIYCAVFVCYGMLFHFAGKSIFNSVSTNNVVPVLSLRNDVLLLVITLNLVLQCIVVSKREISFATFFLPPAINLIACIAAMFATAFGIVNVVWSLIFTGCVCGYMLALFFMNEITNSMTLVQKIREFGQKTEYIGTLKKDADKWMRLGTQAFIALGGALGVSMSILFKDGVKEGDITGWSNPDTLMTAAIMVWSFLWVTIGGLFSLGKPYFDITIKLRNLQRDVVTDAYNHSKSLT